MLRRGSERRREPVPRQGATGGPGGGGGREPRPAAGRGEVQAAPGGRAAVGSGRRQELVPRRGAAGGRAALGARPKAGRGGEPSGGGSLCPRVGAGREKEE